MIRPKIPKGLFGADSCIHTRPRQDKPTHDRRMEPHGSVEDSADFCLEHCPHPDRECRGSCTALKKELKRRKAEKKK